MCGGEGEGGWRVRRGGARYGSFADGRRTSPFSNSRGSLEGPLMLFLLLPFLFLPFFFFFLFRIVDYYTVSITSNLFEIIIRESDREKRRKLKKKND